MDKPDCSDASDAWELPHVITITSSSESEEERHDERHDDHQAVSHYYLVSVVCIFYFNHSPGAHNLHNVLLKCNLFVTSYLLCTVLHAITDNL